MASKFEIHLVAPANLVGDIVELMDGEGVIVNIKPHDAKSNGTRHHYVGGKKNKGISGEAAALLILKESNKPMTPTQVGKIMASKHNFAVSSASPVLSNLKIKKKVSYKDGSYSLVK